MFTKWILQKDQVNQPENYLDFLEDLCEKWFEPIIKLKNKTKNVMIQNYTLNQQILNFCKLFDIYYQLYFAEKIPNYKNEKVSEFILVNIEKTFVYSMVWTIGMDLDLNGRVKFD